MGALFAGASALNDSVEQTTNSILRSATMKQATKLEAVTQPRTIERIVTGVATSDGAGVKLTRVLTQNLQQRLDRF